MAIIGAGAMVASVSSYGSFVGFTGYYDVPANGLYQSVGTTPNIGAGSPGWTLLKTVVPAGAPDFNTGTLNTYGPGSIALHGSQATMGAGTLAFTIPTHYLPNENGFTFDWNGTLPILLHAGDDYGYIVGASSYSLKGTSITPIVVHPSEGETFGFYVTSSGDGLQPDFNVANYASVPEPATIAMNGLVLVGAAAGWVWNRRRKAS